MKNYDFDWQINEFMVDCIGIRSVMPRTGILTIVWGCDKININFPYIFNIRRKDAV